MRIPSTDVDQRLNSHENSVEPATLPSAQGTTTQNEFTQNEFGYQAEKLRTCITEDLKTKGSTLESAKGGELDSQKGNGIAQNLTSAFVSAISSLNPFHSIWEKQRHKTVEVCWNVIFHPEILQPRKRLQICWDCASCEKTIDLSPVVCAKRDCLQHAVAKIQVPLNCPIQYSYYVTSGSERKTIEGSARLISIPAACEKAAAPLPPPDIEVLDDIILFKRSQYGLQDLIFYRLDRLLLDATSSSTGTDRSIQQTISRLDLMLSIKVSSGSGISGATERFGAHMKTDIRRAVAEWCINAVINSQETEKKSEICIFCSAILGYFDVSSSDMLKTVHSKLRKACHCFEEAVGFRAELDKVIQAFDAKSKEYSLSGVQIFCTAMVQSNLYGWMALLYLINLDSEHSLKMNSHVQEGQSFSVSDDSRNFADALQRSGLTRDQKGFQFVLNHVPSIYVLLRDPNLKVLFRASEIASRLTAFITRAGNRMELSRDSQSNILEWLTSLSISPDVHVIGCDEGQRFNLLLRALFCVQLPVDRKIDFMLLIATILGKASRESTEDLTEVYASSLQITADFVSQLQKPAKHRVLEMLRGVWSATFDVEAIFNEAVAHPPLASPLENLCRLWLHEIDDKEFINLFSLILNNEADGKKHKTRTLSAGLRRCDVNALLAWNPMRRLCLAYS